MHLFLYSAQKKMSQECTFESYDQCIQYRQNRHLHYDFIFLINKSTLRKKGKQHLKPLTFVTKCWYPNGLTG